MKRTLRWLAVNGLFCFLVYLWLFREVAGAGNVVMPWAWAAAVINIARLMDVSVAELRKRRPEVPRWFAAVVELGCVVVLLWFGAFWTALACFLSWLWWALSWEMAKTPEKKEATA